MKLEIEQNHKYEVEISTYNVLPENYSIKFDFGDGTPGETGKNSRLEHKYEKSAIYSAIFSTLALAFSTKMWKTVNFYKMF